MQGFYYMHLLLIQPALFCFELLSLITISATTPALRVRPELNIFLIWLIGEIADLLVYCRWRALASLHTIERIRGVTHI